MARNVSTVEEFLIPSYSKGLHFLSGKTENLAVSTISREYFEGGWREVTNNYKGFTIDNPGGRAFEARPGIGASPYIVFISKGNKYKS